MELKHAHLTRQLDLIPLDKLTSPVHVVGCGAIGSFLTLQLVKMGMTNVTCYDMDTVSIENMSCQFFRFKDLGRNKAEALADLVEDFTGVKITAVAAPWKPGVKMQGIVVSAVDNMELRGLIFGEVRKMFSVNHFIDTRMGAETALMYVMNPHDGNDVEAYAKTLYTDKDSVQERCTAKSTIYTANLLSGWAVKAVKNLICKQQYARVTQWAIGSNEMLAFNTGGK